MKVNLSLRTPNAFEGCEVVIPLVLVFALEMKRAMHAQRNTAARSGEHCCYGNATLSIVVDLNVRCQRYKTVDCCHGNRRMGFICTVVQLQNISCCCLHSKGPYVYM